MERLMVNFRKYIFSVIITALIINFGIISNVFADSDDVSQAYSNIPKEATDYIEDNYLDIISVTQNGNSELAQLELNWDSLKVCEPFIVDRLDIEYQDEIYYYPIADDKDKIWFVIALANTTNGWCMTLNQEYVDDLNKADYIDKSAVIYAQKDQYCLINSDVELGELKNDRLENIDYIEDINNTIEQMQKIDTNDINNQRNNMICKSGGFLSNTNKNVILDYFHGSVGQGPHGLCWAASMASIINFIKDTNYTAINIADMYGIGYDIGANIDSVETYFKDFNIYYRRYLGMLTPTQVKRNLKAKKPIYVTAYSAARDAGHAVTTYGWASNNGNMYYSLWNPGLEYGDGGSCIITYIDDYNTSFTYYGSQYVINNALAYK